MGYSNFLKSRSTRAKELIKELSKDFEYVSILGSDVKGIDVNINRATTSVENNTSSESGFVIKVYNGKGYSEYSCSDLDADAIQLAKKIKSAIILDEKLTENMVSVVKMKDEKLVKIFIREDKGKKYSLEEIVENATAIRDEILGLDEKIINAIALVDHMEVSKMFYSENKELEQYYSWNIAVIVSVMKDGNKIIPNQTYLGSDNLEEVLKNIKSKIPDLIAVNKELLTATPIEPGIYDIIVNPSVAGLIAHEAFGHGVEMDMFVKNRALAKEYIGKYVASPIVTMHDGASSVHNVASYFFDDDGVLAQDTIIIKDGILMTGISDALSALQLKSTPTGNGRREKFSRKAYSRMTNTFFAPGKDSLEDMIKSIEHGYMLFDTDNGMEDPKNWNIQCTASYGKEIKNGKFTGKIVKPVVMSGFVPDLLKSISMISSDFEVFGAGRCGKGHKEWVRVSDGGPYLKARVKLG